MVYPRPETLPLVIPITVSSVQDLANIEAAAAADPKWLISVYSYRRYYDGIFPYNLLPYNYPGVRESFMPFCDPILYSGHRLLLCMTLLCL